MHTYVLGTILISLCLFLCECSLQNRDHYYHPSGEKTEVGGLSHLPWVHRVRGSLQTRQPRLTSIWRGFLNLFATGTWKVMPPSPPCPLVPCMPPKIDLAVGYFKSIFLRIAKLTPTIVESISHQGVVDIGINVLYPRCYHCWLFLSASVLWILFLNIDNIIL